MDPKNAAIYSFMLSNMYHKDKNRKEEIAALRMCLDDNNQFYMAIVNLG